MTRRKEGRAATGDARPEAEQDPKIGLTVLERGEGSRSDVLHARTDSRIGINNPSGNPEAGTPAAGVFVWSKALREGACRGSSMIFNPTACCICAVPFCCPSVTEDSNRECRFMAAGNGLIKPAGLLPKRSLGEKYAATRGLGVKRFFTSGCGRDRLYTPLLVSSLATVNCC